MNGKIVTPKELHDLHVQGVQVDLIDVRTPVEFREVHVSLARNIPLDSLDVHAIMHERNGNADEPLYVICRGGSRGSQACEQFVKEGYSNVVNVDGGTMAWDEFGLPVNRGKKVISLERQVRIAAGLLAIVGAVLAILVHPYFIGLSGFVGAGLMFAGLTDSCAMGMLLARMPWNRVKPVTTCSLTN